MSRWPKHARPALLAIAVSAVAAACAPTGTVGVPTSTHESDVTISRPEPTPPPTPSPTTGARTFAGAAQPIGPELRARLTHSWRPGCPVDIGDLRILTVDHWDFDGNVRTGELIVHADHAEALVGAFRRIFDAGFPIERIELVEVYEGDDVLLGENNVTSAANCRPVTGRASGWSQHAYGLAIDINPRRNPYVKGDVLLPANGAAFLDRALDAPGMIHAGDAVVEAFADIGWQWGGNWRTLKDYQHFSASGR